MTTVTPVRRGSRKRLAGTSAALAGAAAAATAVVMLTGLTGSPAHAVTKAADGRVNVQINELSDPAGLQSELADAGVTAVVDYLPFGQTCKEPRGAHGSLGGEFAASIRKEGDGIAFTIEKGQVPAGQTLVLAFTKAEDGDDRPPVASRLEVVKGAVAPCEATSMPLPPAGDTMTGKQRNDERGLVTRTEAPGKDQGPVLDSTTG
ncbi:hypothetical protein E1292_42815 [Nonomuraea deserti]|uniref:Uncharacterized protein n=1 Tax=Nonomuraea deserti TaxID=1848322 RepID=A0A4R4URR2_9ACTN|nr:hypothetical protein [Nonomuraea deserti]TDC91283.1 hypothetical protein E1292_42815 [Nonomuraea deserti]